MIRKTTLAAMLLCFCLVNLYAQKTYVVSVGIGNYKYPKICNYLPCSEGDARAVSRFFHNYNGSSVFMLLNENATRSHILKVLKKEFAKSTAKDEIIFVFSGHGLEGGLTCYETKDINSIITYEEILNIMKSSKARRKILLTMACYSGGLAQQSVSRKSNYNKNSSVMIYTSSRPNETSWEWGLMNNSFFIDRVLEAFKGAADANNDKKVTARELFNYVNPRVINDTENKQHPQLWGRFDDSMVVVYVK